MHTSLKTYIVEDNVTIRENLIGTLEELTSIEAVGYAEAENEAREWLHTHGREWELAIVDLFLKQGSGLGVVQECLQREPHQKVVVLSNYATNDMRERSRALGADAFFDKSAEIDQLLAYCEAAHRAT